jgi:hypothetical protein
MSLVGRIIIGWWVYATTWIPPRDSRGYEATVVEVKAEGRVWCLRRPRARWRLLGESRPRCCKGGVAFCVDQGHVISGI